MITPTQKDTIEAIVNIFETGEVLGDYSLVTVLEGDTGHLTYGRSQTTLGSGNLHTLIRRYCEQSGALFASRLHPYLAQLQSRDVSLDKSKKLHNLLRASADDPVMRDTQDSFFDEFYWQRAVRSADDMGIRTPLGIAVVYDSMVHGSWERMRNRTNDQMGPVSSAGEEKWISTYVDVRRTWLASRPPDTWLPRTVYRMDAFRRLIDQHYWALPLPLVVRNVEISTAAFSATPRGCYDGPQPGSRSLSVSIPLARGLDVRLVQLGLSNRGVDLQADGIFGQTSSRCLREFQAANGLVATGIADPSLIMQLIA